MKKLALLLPALALAACGEEPAPAPTPTPTEVVETSPRLAPPTRDTFAEVYAESCPDVAKPVNNASCIAMGMGSDQFSCDYGLGEDEALRHEAQLVVNEAGDGFMLDDAENICQQGQ